MQVGLGRTYIGRLEKGSDILEALKELCKREGITLAVFSILGSASNVKLGYYNRNTKRYTECVTLDRKLEIASCIGNVSLRGSELSVHAHIIMSDLTGRCCGGHLMYGSSALATEYFLRELKGGELERKHDPETGLNLWDEE